MSVKVFVDCVKWQKCWQNIEFNFMIYHYYTVRDHSVMQGLLVVRRLKTYFKVMNRHCTWVLEKLPWKQTKKNGLLKWNWKLIELSNPRTLAYNLPQAAFTITNRFPFLECQNDRLMEWMEFVWVSKLFINHKWRIRYRNVYCCKTHRVTAQKKKRKKLKQKHSICFLVLKRKKVSDRLLATICVTVSFRSRNRVTSWFPSAK